MTILSLPTLTRRNATQCQLSLIANTQAFESPLNKSVQTGELPGARWQLSLSWQNLDEQDARILKAFLLKLRGMAGRFYAGDVSHKAPSGTAAGNGLVNGGDQGGRSIITDGWAANQAQLLLPGDYIGIGGELKLVTDVIASDSSGQATITFEPPLRAAPADNAPITTTFPTCIFRLVDDNQDQINFDPERRPSVTLSAVEVF